MGGDSGNATYKYWLGDGYDTLTDSAGSDTLRFEDIDVSAASFFNVGFNLEIAVGGGQGVLVKNQLAGGSNQTPVEFFIFGGTSYSAAQIAAMAVPK